MKPAVFVAMLFLSAVAVAHLLRLVLQVPITAGGIDVPMGVSVFGILGPGAIAVWLWRTQRE